MNLIHVTGAEALAELSTADPESTWTVAITMFDGIGEEHLLTSNPATLRGAIAHNDEIRFLKRF